MFIDVNWLNWFHFLILEGGLSNRYSDRLHDFSVTIPRCYQDVYVNSFFPCSARLWNSLPIECFRLTYDLSGFKSRINRHLFNFGSFLNRFPICFNLLCFFFLVALCLAHRVNPKSYKYDSQSHIYIFIFTLYIYMVFTLS